MVFAMVLSRLGSAIGLPEGAPRVDLVIALALRLGRFAGQTPREEARRGARPTGFEPVTFGFVGWRSSYLATALQCGISGHAVTDVARM